MRFKTIFITVLMLITTGLTSAQLKNVRFGVGVH